MSLASLFNLAGPDLVIIALILAMLGSPLVVVLVVLRFTNRPNTTPPPLPKTGSSSTPKTSEEP